MAWHRTNVIVNYIEFASVTEAQVLIDECMVRLLQDEIILESSYNAVELADGNCSRFTEVAGSNEK